VKILLTVNGTTKSESIIPFVIELARRWKAEILVARALDPVAIGEPLDPVSIGEPLVPVVAETFYQQMLRSGEDYLKELGKRFQGVPFRTFCLVGSPGECVRHLAVNEHCDLLVMASHGHTGFVRWLWGSVAENLARVAPCPVLLVRRDTPALFRQVLVPIDGTEPSWNVVEHLSRFVDPAYARVTLLHCSDPTEGEEMADRSARERIYQARCDLKNLMDGKPWLHLQFTSTKAPDGIYDWLADNPCDLIAMSTHGREGLAHLWSGSVMEQVARNVHCPLLVFPPAPVKAQIIA